MQPKSKLGQIDISDLQIPSGPPSPTLSTVSFMSSVSWMAEKTSNDLIPMLKNAYSALKDKEKDLLLAAELGKSLLEHNLKLKANYDNLLKNSTPPITPSASTETVIQDEDSGIDSCDEDQTMRFVPSRGTRDAMIEVLERNNHEMAHKLEQAMQEQDSFTRVNTKNTRKLENEISLLQSNLEIATYKIQELHQMNEKQKKVEFKETAEIDESKDELVDELYDEINKAEMEKYEMEQSKLELELKLATTLKDLRELRDQFERFEFTQQDYEKLQEAYERQFAHIDELNSSLEEHRAVLQKLKEKGVTVYSAQSTPAPSEYGEPHSSLLGELESAWIKKNSLSLPTSFTMDFAEKSMMALRAPSVGLESILSKATGLDQRVLDDTLHLIHQIEQEHYEEKRLALYHPEEEEEEGAEALPEVDFDLSMDLPEDHLYPDTIPQLQIAQYIDQASTTFIQRLRLYIRKMFRIIWRWCRFSMILTTALLISAWQGPDSLLIAYQ